MLSGEIMTPGDIRHFGSINTNLSQYLPLLRIAPATAALATQYLLQHYVPSDNDVVNDDNIDVSLKT